MLATTTAKMFFIFAITALTTTPIMAMEEPEVSSISLLGGITQQSQQALND